VPGRDRAAVPALVLAMIVVGAACTAGTDRDGRPSRATPADGPLTPVAEQALTADDAAALALTDVERFWSQRRGDRTLRLRGGVVVFGREGEDAYDCGGAPVPAEVLRENAVYCPAADSVVWDAAWLATLVRSDAGARAVALVTAHEVGHAVQARDAPGPQEPLGAELQADCFAGAWAASLVGGRSTVFRATEPDVAPMLLTLMELRDPLGASAARGAAHGTGFDRVVAFLDGYGEGEARCFAYPGAFRGTTSQSWADRDDEARAGDLPLGNGYLAAVRRDLVAFGDAHGLVDPGRAAPRLEWVNAGEPGCGGPVDPAAAVVPCPDGALEVRGGAAVALAASGDFALGAAVARAWFDATLPERVRAGGYTPECLTGAWMGGLHPGARPRDRALVLSPGDLDEAVRWIVGNGDRRWTDRLSAFVTGVYEGVDGCIA
jgi:predicted metalloprotease